LDAVDFCVFQAHDMHHVGLIAQQLGRESQAQRWFGRAQLLSCRIHTHLWDPDRRFYMDRYLDGRFSEVEASSGLLPLLLDDCPSDHVAALVEALRDPQRFGTPLPVPSVTRAHPAFSCDMWRGPMWINFNYLIVLALRKHGLTDLAQAIAQRTVEAVQRYYEMHGVFFEFYDALGERSPAACDRKGPRSGPYLSRPYGDAIRDYHWTAALTASLLLDL
jgi:neutral trehalase